MICCFVLFVVCCLWLFVVCCSLCVVNCCMLFLIVARCPLFLCWCLVFVYCLLLKLFVGVELLFVD